MSYISKATRTETCAAAAVAFIALIFLGCADNGTTADAGDGGGTTDSGGVTDGGGDTGTLDGAYIDLTNSVENCVKALGWQADFTYDADMIGLPDSSGTACTDAMTVDWFQEGSGSDFTHVIAWSSIGASTCTTRTPPPAVDAAICTFKGTHKWSVVPGVNPSTRMVLTEDVTTASGDFAGKGTDDKCGPLSISEGTSIRYIVTLDGPCASGIKAWIWEPETSDTEPFPGNMFTDATGRAKPYRVCNNPGSIGPADHLTGRKICPTTFVVVDEDK